MSPSTPSTSRLSNTAPEAKSNPAVSPQPNRKNGAGTPARPMVSSPPAASGNSPKSRSNVQSPPAPPTTSKAKQPKAASGKGSGTSNEQPSALPDATWPALPGKGKATQATVASGKGSGNGSNKQSSASPRPTRPAPLAKGKATEGAGSESGQGSAGGSNEQPSASSDPTPPPPPNTGKGKQREASGNGSGNGSDEQPSGSPGPTPIAISAEHPRQFQQHVYMLVDGDKYIFQRSWVDQGREGGRRASTAITESVHKYYNRSTNYKLWIYLFFNLKGQISTLASDGYNLRHFGDFLHGFQAPGMNFVVDTGRRKESADTKLKEMFQAYIRSPETKGIFLAVCHDGGYAETIDRELIPDFRSKIIRVKSGYVAQDIWALTNLPDIPPNFFTEGLFIKNPWPSSNDNGRNSVDKGRNRFTPWTAMRRDNSRPQSRLSTYTQEDRSPAPSPLCYTPETLVGELPSHFPQVLEYWEPQKDDYPGVDCILDPINTCRYISRPSPGFETAPDLNLQVGPHPDSESPDAGTIARFRAHIERSSPCPGGAQCSRFGCPWAHVCPYGPCCELLRNGHCNFAQDMHNNLKEIASSLGATQKALADDTMQTREFRKILQRMISRIDSSKLAPRHP